MIARALPHLVSLLVLAGCRQLLDIPSDPSAADGGGGTGEDASPGDRPDGAPGDEDGGLTRPDGGGDRDDAGIVSCRPLPTVFVGFDDPAEIEDWEIDQGGGCEIGVEVDRLAIRQTDPPAFCRVLGELPADMANGGMQVMALEPGNPAMSLVYSLILNDGGGDIRSRRRLRIERDGGFITLGDCIDDDCDSNVYGSIAFDPKQHVWWRFDHDSADSSLHFEFASDDEIFSRPAGVEPVPAITPEMVRCFGVELGSNESGADTGRASFDFLVGGS